MNNSIPQNTYDTKQLKDSIQTFFSRFKVASLLKSSNARKEKGISPIRILQYLFLLIFRNKSMYMDQALRRDEMDFAKDTVYRFMKNIHINWNRFTALLAAKISIEVMVPATSDNRVNAFVIDDTVFSRNRSKKVELLTKIYDHAAHKYLYGFRMLTLGWTDGNSFLPVAGTLLSSENKKTRVNEAIELDRRTNAYKRRRLAVSKGTDAMLELLKEAKKVMIPADYVLFDSWFSSPKTLHAVKDLGYDVIAMIKKSDRMKFGHQGMQQSLKEIYTKNRKRRGRSKYLLSVEINVDKDGKTIPARVVYVRNRTNRKEYLCIISTNMNIDENEIIRIYSKRWQIEVFFKVCKSYLKLSRECSSLSYDSMSAHVAIVFARYMMLSVNNRETADPRTLGEIFLYFMDELADVTFLQAFNLLMEMFREKMKACFDLSESQINDMMDEFMTVL
ncbi:MAG: transposase, partial [Oscillospiraceae bacterium]|nr:transposase [Oscillospiraceae bacterium]